MTQIDAKQVMALREETGAGAMECRKALVEANGDKEKAKAILRQKGAATAEKKAARTAAEGRVYAYVHHNNRVGVLIEVNCETDFVARNEDFEKFLKNLCLHIAFKQPRWISREHIPAAERDKERATLVTQARDAGQRTSDAEIDQRLDKLLGEACLLEQAFVMDEKQTIEDLRKAIVAKCGENVVIRRFSVFEIGR